MKYHTDATTPQELLAQIIRLLEVDYNDWVGIGKRQRTKRDRMIYEAKAFAVADILEKLRAITFS